MDQLVERVSVCSEAAFGGARRGARSDQHGIGRTVAQASDARRDCSGVGLRALRADGVGWRATRVRAGGGTRLREGPPARTQRVA